MKKFLKMTILLTTAAVIAVQATGITAFATQYNDYDTITNTGISISVPKKLTVAKPSSDTVTSASAYYITGTSNPDEPLYMNGKEVSGRGNQGSFGVLVSLDSGANTFTFKQSSASKSVTITRSKSVSSVSTTKVITGAYPTYNDAAQAGKEYLLKCTAPSGASVSVVINGKKHTMKQEVAAKDGTPAFFKYTYSVPDIDSGKTVSLGNIEYILTYNGNTTSYTSAGELFVVGRNADLVVKVTEEASTVRSESSDTSSFVTVLRKGSTDRVVDQTSKMYKLSMGGWILRDAVSPVKGNPAYQNKVSGVNFERVDGGERIVLSGTAHPSFTSSMNDERVRIKLFNTSGVDSVSVSGSKMFSSADVSTENGATVITLNKKSASSVWGYNVEYADGQTILYCKKAPSLSGDASRPLAGVKVAVDAGHGGSDNGAGGTAFLNGPTEKDLTLAAAISTRKRLESLGATVIMTRSDDSKVTLNERMALSQANDADFFISLHYNSIALGTDGNKPNGVEIYYYENTSKAFANTILNKLTSYTGRSSRGAKFSNYRVTLMTSAPAVLCELGFISNPKEYDAICTKDSLFNTANAVGDAVLASLS